MTRKTNWPGALILGAFVVLALAYSIVNPVFESPDELNHYDFVRYLIERHALPVQTLGVQSEYFEPPLYYVLGALVSSAIPVDTFRPQDNPFFGYDAYRFGVDNKVRYIHTTQEAFPYQGTVLAVHVLRCFSILLGGLSLLVSFQVLREVFKQSSVVLGAMAIIALNPQFILVSSSISNDNMIILLASLMIWLAVRIARSGVTRRRAATLAVLTAMAVLTKLSAAVLVLVPLGGMLIARTSLRRWIRTLALLGVVLLMFTSWWFVRNLMLYGEPTGIQMWQQIWGWQSTPVNLSDVGIVLQNLWTSYWGRFGLGQIVLPYWVYSIWLIIAALSLIGFIRNIKGWRKAASLQLNDQPGYDADRRGIGVLGMTLGLLLLAAIWYALVNPAGTAGRFLFPAMTAIGGLMAYGLRDLCPTGSVRIDKVFVGVTCSSMIAFGLGSLIGVIAPAYAPPASISIEDVRRQTRSVDIRFGDAVILLGYAIDQDRVLPGNDLQVTLCWQPLAATATPAYFFIHLLGENDSMVGQRSSLHGLGRYPSINWSAGRIFCDIVPLRVSGTAPAPRVYQVEVGVVDLASDKRLTPTGPGNVQLSPAIITQIKVRSSQKPNEAIPHQTEVELGQQIDLIGSDVRPPQVIAGEAVTVTLYWRAKQVPVADYTVFVHMIDSQGQMVAQADSQPQSGSYPTSFWDVDELVADPHTLSIPAGVQPDTYTVRVGLYQLTTGERLPVDGTLDNEIEIGKLVVTSR